MVVMSFGIRQYTIKDLEENNQINFNSSVVTLGITYDEKDPYFDSDASEQDQDYSLGQKYKVLEFQITSGGGTNQTIRTIFMGKTDMYEITQPIRIQSIRFPHGAPKSIQINRCDREEEE